MRLPPFSVLSMRLRSVRSAHAPKIFLFVSAFLVLGAGGYFLSPPSSFPVNQLITITPDAAAGEFAAQLESTGALRSPFIFLALARITGLERSLDPGTYLFTKPLGVLELVDRIGHGEHGIDPVRVTFTEGMTVSDIGNELAANLPAFNREAFLLYASTSEGYLFPDTYFFMPGDAPEDIVVRLRTRFGNQIASVTPEIMAYEKSVREVVIMASLLEREARGLGDKRMVAGILWNRLAIDMPLQVDAVFGYIRGENGYTPTGEDLEFDSPYNTYLYRGLPPAPIANPGLESILAAVTPTESDYLYYLTGRDGLMYYATTFEEHKKNRELYLD